MPTNVIMPQMGESVAEGTITKWFKKLGDRIERDEPLFEISTDKVDAEVPSPAAGILAEILVKETETVPVNTVVAVIDGERAAVAAPPAEEAREVKPEAKSPARQDVVPATPGPSKSPGAIGASAVPSRGEKVRSSPLVRRIAREHKVDLSLVRGTGLGGRISKKDILAFLAQGQPTEAPGPAASSGAPGMPPPGPLPEATAPHRTAPPPIVFTGPTQVVPMTPMRKLIAEHMVASKRTSAHVATVFEVEMTKVVEMRERGAEEFERRNGLKLTYTPFFVRAVLEAIKEFPLTNSSVESTNIVYKRDVNIGVAVALETGLIVPVIKRADEKNFLGIARAIQDLAERARTKRLSVEDVQGGTFTITNPGSFGSLLGTPIINQPQVAILGVGVIEKRPVVRHDAIAIRPMVYLTLSFDHRIIDGAVADQFMGRIKGVLEKWSEPVL
jgi:2-oxoglutarate dehydrogenase E2 component (dihydrolipoamide succinyltransferase)